MLCCQFSNDEYAIFDSYTNSQLFKSQSDDAGAFCTAFTPFGAVSIRSRQARICTFSNNSPQPRTRQTFPCEFSTIQLDLAGNAAIGTSDGRTYFFNKFGEFIYISHFHSRKINCISLYNNYIVSGSEDGSFCVSIIGGQKVAQCFEHGLAVNFVQFWREKVISGGNDRKIRVSELVAGSQGVEVEIRQILTFQEEVKLVSVLGDKIYVVQGNKVICKRLMSFEPECEGQEVFCAEKMQITSIMSSDASCDVYVGLDNGIIKVLHPKGGITDVFTKISAPVVQMSFFAQSFSNLANVFSGQFKKEVTDNYNIGNNKVNMFLPKQQDLSKFLAQKEEKENEEIIDQKRMQQIVKDIAALGFNVQ